MKYLLFYCTPFILLFLTSCGYKGHIEIDNNKGIIREREYNYNSDDKYYYGEIFLYNDSESEKFEFTIREDERTFFGYIPTKNEEKNYLDNMEESKLSDDIKNNDEEYRTFIIKLNPGEIERIGYNYEVIDYNRTYYNIYNKNQEELNDELNEDEKEKLNDNGESFHKRKLKQLTFKIVGAKKVTDNK